jgi:hypothetical protein
MGNTHQRAWCLLYTTQEEKPVPIHMLCELRERKWLMHAAMHESCSHSMHANRSIKCGRGEEGVGCMWMREWCGLHVLINSN